MLFLGQENLFFPSEALQSAERRRRGRRRAAPIEPQLFFAASADEKLDQRGAEIGEATFGTATLGITTIGKMTQHYYTMLRKSTVCK